MSSDRAPHPRQLARRTAPIFLFTFVLLGASLVGAAALVYAEWQRLTLERGITKAANIHRVRHVNPRTLGAAVLNYLEANGAESQPDWISVTIQSGGLPNRPTAQAADMLREQAAGRMSVDPATVTVTARATITSLGWRRTIELRSVQHVRISPELIRDGPAPDHVGGDVFATGSPTPKPDATAPSVPEPPPPRIGARSPAPKTAKSSPFNSGLEPLLGLLARHRQATTRLQGGRPTPAGRGAIARALAPVEASVERGEYFWLQGGLSVLAYVAGLRALLTEGTASRWTQATALGQAVSDRLASQGIYTPPVDPSVAPTAQ